MTRLHCFALALLVLFTAAPAWAVNPDERLANPVLEARARNLSRELRCLVCQNETIDDSNADLAHDLRVIVRQRLTAGDSDTQVLDYMRARYGDYVLLDPPVEHATWALWYGPAAALGLGAVAIALNMRRRRLAAIDPAPLDADERDALNRLIKDDSTLS